MARCDSDNDSGAGPYTDEDQTTSPVLAPVQQGRHGGVGLGDKRWRVDLAKISAKKAWQTLTEKVDHS